MEFEKLKKVIAEVLNVDPDEITMETTFTDDLGADSLDLFQIIMGLEEEFDIEIPAPFCDCKIFYFSFLLTHRAFEFMF